MKQNDPHPLISSVATKRLAIYAATLNKDIWLFPGKQVHFCMAELRAEASPSSTSRPRGCEHWGDSPLPASAGLRGSGSGSVERRNRQADALDAPRSRPPHPTEGKASSGPGSGTGASMSLESQRQSQTPAAGPGNGRGSGPPGLFEVGQLEIQLVLPSGPPGSQLNC